MRSLLSLGVIAILGMIASCDENHAIRGKTEYVALRFGMTEGEVRDLLGEAFDIDGYGAGHYDWWYTDRPLIVSFNSEGKVVSVSVPREPSSD